MVQASPSGKITLGYWNVRGGPRGNVCRYLLAWGGADWEEKTYVIGEDGWKNDKATLFDFV